MTYNSFVNNGTNFLRSAMPSACITLCHRVTSLINMKVLFCILLPLAVIDHPSCYLDYEMGYFLMFFFWSIHFGYSNSYR